MTHRTVHTLLGVLLTAAFGLAAGVAAAAPPGEVSGVLIDRFSTISWNAEADATDYNVYRGLISDYLAGHPLRCHGDEITATSFTSAEVPATGETFLYLVTAETGSDEGTSGSASSGSPRVLLGSCDTVMRNHVLDRVGYGWDEWSRDRIASLGLQGYINEQLDPASIDESTNTKLNTRMAPYQPPLNCLHLPYQKVVAGTYARRQLEEQAAVFWDNHLNTDCAKVLGFFNGQYPVCQQVNPFKIPPQCDEGFPNKRDRRTAEVEQIELDEFRDLAFNGNFRQMIEASALSAPMIIYLDTDNNVAGRPNENYSRELLELYTMGVDNGYTQTDVEELARVFTGWNVCNKTDANADDPLAPCDALYYIGSGGNWVANFRTAQHDCEAKTLFLGTPYEFTIPDTCDTGGNPTSAGVDDVGLALNGIVAHPSTPEFISTKLLQKYVSENPTQSMIDSIVAEWNDGTNPQGVGDMREVLRAVLDQQALLDPDEAGNKLKTPLETVVSDFRATRGETDGATQVYNYLVRMQHVPNLNQTPTGYSEIGAD
jgi:uncharacterized protein (DUF1800 family)